jgi:hypothetical protein
MELFGGSSVDLPMHGALFRSLLSAAPFAMAMASPAAAQGVEVRVETERGARPGPVDARLGEPVRLVVTRRRGRPLPPGSRIRWQRVAPHLQHGSGHAEGAAPTDPTYSNAVLGGAEHGKWVGMDTIEYRSAPLAMGAHARVEGDALVLEGAPPPTWEERTPSRSAPMAGTLWVAAVVELPDGRVLSTADGDDTDRMGLESAVMRVSFRQGDGFVGWMSAYFGVPYVFGSTPAQSERRVGIDCADVLVGARRAQTGRRLRYTSVRGMGRLAEAVSDVLLLDEDGTVRDAEGEPVALRWGETIQAGDMLAIDYANDGSDLVLPRAWDHIGVLLEDAEGKGTPGVLDGADVLRHMSLRGLTDEPLRGHGRIRLRVWRWKR